MKITILTLFPEMFTGPFDHSIVKKALEKKRVDISIINIRDFGIGKHKTVDDTPYGGGIGMVMRADVVKKAIDFATSSYRAQKTPINQSVILLSASGKSYTQQKAKHLSKKDHIILVCGHYEGVDDRIKKYIDEEISIGDFVITGGEIPAMLIADSLTRLIPDVLKEGVTENESFSIKASDFKSLLEYPQYTKPIEFDNQSVPDVLLSGNHKKIKEWRTSQSLKKTIKTRPDLALDELKNKKT